MDNNTKLFYETLKGGDTELDMYKLFLLSKQNLFLREPLCKYDKTKYQKFIVRISVNSDQLFMVTCFKQYHEFIKIMEKSSVWHLVIINKFILSQLIKEDNTTLIQKISQTWDPSLNLYYMYKYRLISYKVFSLFQPDILKEDTLISIYIIDFFYFKKGRDLTKLFKYMEKSNVLSIIFNRYGRDIDIVRYITLHFLEEESLIPACSETDWDHLNFQNTDLFYIKDESDSKNHQLSQSSFRYFKSMYQNDLPLMKKEFQESGIIFRNKYLCSTDKIDEILKNPENILDLSVKEDFFNYPFRVMFCLCYIVSIIHNNNSPFLPFLFCSLLQNHNVRVRINNHKIIFDTKPRDSDENTEEFQPESLLFNLLKNTPHDTFNCYFVKTQ
ncbi:hypothetical protein PIROE2DRAFT_64348 [Piromyces sp. E2]|nr:hypothetical protein PIROE2DRAFT_64348 [Piromyces sp. E2]|eukprot:OUM58536.1 hypothetical protein PIROE2DRAFT_64348 [Piromyces sp. E2]